MPTVETTRSMTAEESAEVGRILAQASPKFSHRDFWSFFLGSWLALFLLFWVVSALITGVGHLFDNAAVNWINLAAPYGLPGSAVGALAVVLRSEYAQRSGWAQYRRSFAADQVHVTTFNFVDVKRYQEEEHGGLQYLLLTDDGNVLSWFDGESEDLGADDKEPLDSSFRPKNRLELVRTMDRARIVTEVWSGAELPSPDPLPLNASRWPEHGEIVTVAWNQCDSHFGKQRRGKADRMNQRAT